MTAARRLTVDLRMIRHSGIGRYLRNVWPLALPLLQATAIRVLGRRDLIGAPAWLADPRLEFVETAAPVYSLQEQLLPLQGAYRGTDLLWVPHYNVPLVYRGPMIVTLHDVAPLAIPEILGNAVKRGYARMLIERAAHHAAAVLTVSAFTSRELQQRLRVPAERITTTPLGLESDWPASAAAHREQDGVPYLLFVGNVKPNKNLDLLLRALTELREKVPYRLVVVGRVQGLGTMDEAVLEKAKALGDRVRFAGEVTDPELAAFYAGAAALVMPSLYEGFGLPLLEAMQLGCPVLASTAGSLAEVGGDAALYFDPHSVSELVACLLQLADPAAISRLRHRGYARLQEFSFDRCAQQTAAVMNCLLETV